MIATSGIYIIQNAITGDFYGGSSVNMSVRWSSHKKNAIIGSNKCPRLYSSMRKYGIENFKIYPLIICSKENLELYEQKWLDKNYGKMECLNCSSNSISPMRNPDKITLDKLRNSVSKARRGKSSWNKGIPRTKDEIMKIKIGMQKRTPFKLNDHQKLKVIHLYYEKEYTIKTIAEMFGVSPITIQRITKKHPDHSLIERRGGWNRGIVGSTKRKKIVIP